MKILSYNIINEATIDLFNKNAAALGGNFSKDFLKTKRLAKQKGIEGADDALTLMNRFVQVQFNFYDRTTQDPKLASDLNVAFGIYFTENNTKAHLYPYNSDSIANLTEESLEYATLKLYDINTNQILNIENIFVNFAPDKYNFSLNISNPDTFRKINTQYKFENLNQLSQFATAPSRINGNNFIGLLLSSGFRNISQKKSKQQQGHQISFTLIPATGQQPTPIITTLNGLFRTLGPLYDVQFNNAARSSGRRPIIIPNTFNRLSKINSRSKTILIYTDRDIDPTNTRTIYNCWIEDSSNIGQAPINCNIQITGFN